jgi:hypothetical protein
MRVFGYNSPVSRESHARHAAPRRAADRRS